jgi:hypothetical protein
LYEKKILNSLLDKFEKSRSFINENRINQTFFVNASSLFPKYSDHSDYDTFKNLNEAVDILVRKSFVLARPDRAGVFKKIVLNINEIENIYNYAGRVSKDSINRKLISLFESFENSNPVIKSFCLDQYERIRSNRPVKFFNNDFAELENILLAAAELYKLEKETFYRDFSIRVFKNSKVFERISSRLVNFFYEYGSFPSKDQVLGNLNIVKNPGYVNFKGQGSINLNNQVIDFSCLSADIAVSSAVLSDIREIKVKAGAVITIENLTSFHTFNSRGMFIIYLGGYHNSLRREFIKKVFNQNRAAQFYHFGDIDAGGFFILEHLKKMTGIDFKPYKMDVPTLEKYRDYTVPLSDNDKKRLLTLLDSPHNQVVSYMLKNNCKLEQEAVFTGRL